ncbi:hypothetical protein [Roseateles sp. DC23W]
MTYILKEITDKIGNRIVSDSENSKYIGAVIRGGWQDSEFPEGFAIDEVADSYLVMIPFNLPDFRSNGDYAFFYEGKMYHITFLAPSHSIVGVRDSASNKVSPTGDFMDRLAAAFAAHHRLVGVVGGVPKAFGGLVVPEHDEGMTK